MKIEARSQRLYLALITALLVATLLLAAGRLCASTIIPSFHYYGATMGGNFADNQWSNLSFETMPAGVSAGTAGKANQWSAGIMSTNGSAANIFSGNPSFGTDTTDFISSANAGGIYSFFSQTHYQIASSSVLAGMNSLILQLYVAEGLSGMFGGTAVAIAVAPTITLVTTQGVQAPISANFFEQTYRDAAFVNGSNTFLDMMAYQWDLSSVVDPILSYTINWQEPFHGIVYGADVSESNHAAPGSILTVPEPSRALFSVFAFTGLALRRRRRA